MPLLNMYKKLADQGDVFAQYMLGFMYYIGKGSDSISKNYNKALELFQKASAQGESSASFNLAIMYQSGEGVTQNLTKAVKLYERAINQGHVPAKEHRDLLLGVIANANRQKQAECKQESAKANAEAKSYIELRNKTCQQRTNCVLSKKVLQKTEHTSDRVKDLSQVLEYDDYSSVNPINRHSFIEALENMSFARYRPRTVTWTDALILSDERNSLLFLIRKNGIDFKYYADGPLEIICDARKRISTAGGNIYRHNFSGENTIILRKLAGLARDYVYDREAFENYLFNLESNHWLSCAFSYASTKRYFEAVIFDLDNTLIYSDKLSEFRGRKNLNSVSDSYINNLQKLLQDTETLIDQDTLVAMKSVFPYLKIGVLTRSPKTYAHCILKAKYPNINWDIILAYEDLQGKVKPSPQGLYVIASKLGINDLKKIVLVGDETTDVIASYQAGCSSAVYTKCWPEKKTKENWKCIGLVPDGIFSNEKELIDFVGNPQRFRPMLESWREKERSNYCNYRLIGKLDSRYNLYEKIEVLGRYFTKKVGQFDYSNSIRGHFLNEAIIDLKKEECDDYIISCCAQYLTDKQLKPFPDKQIIVCSIPKKKNGRQHMEQFLNRLSEKFSNDQRIAFKADLLEYLPGAQSHKNLNSKQRFENARNYISVGKITLPIRGKTVFIFDDVVTTGATFIYASRCLKKAGANSVHCVGLTQTISGVW